MPGETGSTLELIYVDLVNAGLYRVRVSNACGQDLSNSAEVIVNDIGSPTCIPPTITAHPGGAVKDFGDDITLSVVATGTAPLSYQWKKDGVNLSGETNDTLELIYVENADEGSYTVVVTNACGSESSGSALLVVNDPDNPSSCIPPVITAHPNGAIVAPGDNVTFTVGVDGTAPFTYQWYKNGSPIIGQTANQLQFIYVLEANQGSYTVVVTNACGEIASGSALLSVESDSGGPSSGDSVFIDDTI